jgi:hypothetical protein
MQNIYIIMRNKQVFEIKADKQKFTGVLTELQQKGILAINELGIAINAVDITAVLNTEQYINYINQTRPKTYISNGKTKTLARDQIVGEKILQKLKQKRIGEKTPQQKKQLKEVKKLKEKI